VVLGARPPNTTHKWVHPLRRRVEYCRGGTVGAGLRSTDLPACCADDPDFPPRRSRRLGTGEAASSGRCWSWGSGCCSMGSPPLNVRGAAIAPVFGRSSRLGMTGPRASPAGVRRCHWIVASRTRTQRRGMDLSRSCDDVSSEALRCRTRFPYLTVPAPAWCRPADALRRPPGPGITVPDWCGLGSSLLTHCERCPLMPGV
jgi:hypothetical protein